MMNLLRHASFTQRGDFQELSGGHAAKDSYPQSFRAPRAWIEVNLLYHVPGLAWQLNRGL
jgi:hypothetical protein